MLALIWWMYAGYAWLTNSISTRGLRQRAILLGGMAGYLVLALAVPERLPRQRPGLRRGLLHRRRGPRVALHLDGLGAVVARLPRASPPTTSSTRCSCVVGGALGGTAQAVLWTVAARPRVVARRGWATARARAASRSRPPTSSSATGWWSSSPSASRSWRPGSAPPGWRWTPSSSLAAVLGLLLSAGLWWAYFGADDDEQAERALSRAPARRQPWIALEGFGIAHYFLLLGVVLAAAGIKKAIGHAYDPLATAEALVLGGGVALFLAADVGVPPRPGPRALGAPRRRRAARPRHHPAGHRGRRRGPARGARGDPRRGAGRRGERPSMSSVDY